MNEKTLKNIIADSDELLYYFFVRKSQQFVMSHIYHFVEKYKIIDSCTNPYDVLTYLLYVDICRRDYEVISVYSKDYNFCILYPDCTHIIRMNNTERIFTVLNRMLAFNNKLKYEVIRDIAYHFDIHLLSTLTIEECFVIAARSLPYRPRVWEYGHIIARFLELGYAVGFSLSELGLYLNDALKNEYMIDFYFEDSPSDPDLDERYRNILIFADMMK
jgi:hypothetical protein